MILNLNSVPLFLRPTPVSQQTVERTGAPLPVDAILHLNNDGTPGAGDEDEAATGVVETLEEQIARVQDWFANADPNGTDTFLRAERSYLGAW